jgi:D-serine deaminase-like pyridoxal phosphate-dependent protein
MAGLGSALVARGVPTAISVGDTPGCALTDSFGGVDEIRPGNFVFYDLMQWHIGACREEQIAVAVACPVVAKHASRRQLIIYGGAVHLSRDFLLDEGEQPLYGRIALLGDDGWTEMLPDSFVRSLSQEHGVVQAGEELFNRVEVGDLIVVLPVHSCLTADLLRRYLTLEGQVIEMGRPA